MALVIAYNLWNSGLWQSVAQICGWRDKLDKKRFGRAVEGTKFGYANISDSLCCLNMYVYIIECVVRFGCKIQRDYIKI